MDIRGLFSQKRTSEDISSEPEVPFTESDQEALGDGQSCHSQPPPVDEQLEQPPQKKRQSLSVSEKKIYKAKLSYKKEWEKKYPWVICNNPSEGMFRDICQKWGTPPAGSRGAWSTRGITDWNHATKLLKQHADSQWHRDGAVTADMAQEVESGKTVVELRLSSCNV